MNLFYNMEKSYYNMESTSLSTTCQQKNWTRDPKKLQTDDPAKLRSPYPPLCVSGDPYPYHTDEIGKLSVVGYYGIRIF